MPLTDSAARWTSPLGIAAGLLLSASAIYGLVGIAGAVALHTLGAGSEKMGADFMFSRDVDVVFFGRPPADVMRDHPNLPLLVRIYWDFICGLLVALAIALAALAYLPLRRGEPWALWTSLGAHAAFLSYYWLLIVLPFVRAHSISYWRMWHPLAVYPTIVVPIAGVLAWRAMSEIARGM